MLVNYNVGYARYLSFDCICLQCVSVNQAWHSLIWVMLLSLFYPCQETLYSREKSDDCFLRACIFLANDTGGNMLIELCKK